MCVAESVITSASRLITSAVIPGAAAIGRAAAAGGTGLRRRERGGEAEAEVVGRAGVGEEVSIERGPGHGLGRSAGGEHDREREEAAGRHRGG